MRNIAVLGFLFLVLLPNHARAQVATLPAGYEIVTKFGRVTAVGASPVLVSGISANPAPLAPAAGTDNIQIVSASADDASAGTGCREVTIIGMDGSFEEITEVLATNGVTPVAASTNTSWSRVHRAYCSAQGKYLLSVPDTTATNIGSITISTVGGGEEMGVIRIGRGQSEHAAYTIPAGHTGYLSRLTITVDASNNNSANVGMYQRRAADDATLPVEPTRVVTQFTGVSGFAQRDFSYSVKFPEKTDIWLTGTEAGTGTDPAVEATFTLMLVPNGFADPWFP